MYGCKHAVLKNPLKQIWILLILFVLKDHSLKCKTILLMLLNIADIDLATEL